MGSPLLTLRARIRFDGGACRELDIERWLAEADDVDLRLLDRVQGPVIDIGCGPGRHVEALTTRQVDALGIDLSPDFVALAQARDRRVLLRSVFGPLPQKPRGVPRSYSMAASASGVTPRPYYAGSGICW